jgi:hypothetical protein
MLDWNVLGALREGRWAVTYHAHSIATPIRANIEYSIHENGGPSSKIEPSSAPESPSVSGSYSFELTLAGAKSDLMRSIVARNSSSITTHSSAYSVGIRTSRKSTIGSGNWACRLLPWCRQGQSEE